MDSGHPEQPADAFTLAIGQLHAAGSIDSLMQQVVDTAVGIVEGCTWAGVTTYRDGRLNSPAVSDPVVLAIDAMQYSMDNGPCVDAIRGPSVFVSSPDVKSDPRFERFGSEAARHGCHAMMAHRLYVDTRTLGSVNFYADRTDAFDGEDRRTATVLSAMASLGINALHLEAEGEGLRLALQSRDVIGQAKGVLMERNSLNDAEAFDVLRRYSQTQNRKLREVAEEVVQGRVKLD